MIREITNNPAAFFALLIVSGIIIAWLLSWVIMVVRNYFSYRARKKVFKNEMEERDIRKENNWPAKFKDSYYHK